MNDIVKRDAMIEISKSWGVAGQASGSLNITCDIAQASNKKKMEIGKFNFSNPEWKPQAKIEGCVIIYPGRTRVLYGKGYVGTKRRCGSENWATPSKMITNPINTSCLECPLAKWKGDLTADEIKFRSEIERETEKYEHGGAPLCKDTLNFVLVDDRMVPFSIRANKKAFGTVTKELMNRIKYKGKMPYQVSFTMGIKEIPNPKGAYFDYAFSEFRDLTEEEQQPFKEMFQFYEANGVSMMEQHIANMDKEKDVTSSEFNYGANETT